MSAGGRRPSAVIVGCGGPGLSAAEEAALAALNPLGLILFARNCDTPAQVRGLVEHFRAVVGRRSAPVLIDQEGGRVARLRPPGWPAYPPVRRYGDLARSDRERGLRAAWLGARLIADDLSGLGITVDCWPVLDVPAEDSDPIIGDRSPATDPALVVAVGGAILAGLAAGGIVAVAKHVPGHGRARVDSHLSLPHVDAPVDALRRDDFAPFRALHDAPWAMTAHIVYDALDPQAPATTSRRVVEDVIRGEIGFEGVLVSDDIDMKALSGPLAARAGAALAAGCDVVLQCSGRVADLQALAGAVPPLTDAALARLARTAPAPAAPFDRAAAQAELAALLDGAAATGAAG